MKIHRELLSIRAELIQMERRLQELHDGLMERPHRLDEVPAFASVLKRFIGGIEAVQEDIQSETQRFFNAEFEGRI